jgi:hypothetical protein
LAQFSQNAIQMGQNTHHTVSLRFVLPGVGAELLIAKKRGNTKI